MADCCIKAHQVKPVSLVKAALGSGRLRRFLLTPAQIHDANSAADAAAAAAAAAARLDDDEGSDGDGNGAGASDGANGDGEDGSGKRGKHVSASDAIVMQFMTLEHAHQYLQNALVLIQRHTAEEDTASTGGGGSGSTTTDNAKMKTKTKGATNGAVAGLDGGMWQVQQAVLLNMAYVSLCLSNPVQAVRHAKQLLEMSPQTDPSARVQARLYCAEAQCLLSRVVDAQRTLSDGLETHATQLQQAEQQAGGGHSNSNNNRNNSSSSSHSGSSNRQVRPSQLVAMLIALANVHILQEQLDEAGALVRRALKLSPGLAEGLRLMVYINLKRGRTGHVLRLIKTHEVPSD